MTTKLEELPEELLLSIISFLDWKYIVCNILYVSKQLTNILDTDIFWKVILSNKFNILKPNLTNIKNIVKNVNEYKVRANTVLFSNEKKETHNHYSIGWPPNHGHPNYWSLLKYKDTYILNQTDNFLHWFSTDVYIHNIKPGKYTIYWDIMIKDYFSGTQDLEFSVSGCKNNIFFIFLKEEQSRLSKVAELCEKDDVFTTLVIKNINVSNERNNIIISLKNTSNFTTKFGYSVGDCHLVPNYLQKKINNEIVDFSY